VTTQEVKNRSYRLRPANDSDVSAIRLLVNDAYKELADMGLNYTATFQDETITRNRMAKGRTFVLEQNDRIIGTVLFTVENYLSQKKTAYVSQLAVDSKLKKCGLGTLLMEHCEDLARREGFEGIQLDTAKPAKHLVEWYLRRGYAILGDAHWEGKTYESWIFEKPLSAEAADWR
jgi:predicted N-acetyltransferase YhbS